MDLLELSKTYIRIDSEEDEVFLKEVLIPATENYFKNAGINTNYYSNKEDPLYKLAVQMLVCNWYEKRGCNVSDIPKGIKGIINQLKFGLGDEE